VQSVLKDLELGELRRYRTFEKFAKEKHRKLVPQSVQEGIISLRAGG
jgi:hypothetical protein